MKVRTKIRNMMMITIFFAAGGNAVFAGGLDLGLGGPLSVLATALSSGIASWVLFIAIGVGGLMWALGSRNEDGMKRIGQVVIAGTLTVKGLAFITALGLFGAVL